MKLRFMFIFVVGLLSFASCANAFLYSNSSRFNESLDIEHDRYYFKGSDYYVWSDKKEYNSVSAIYSFSFKDESIKKHYQADGPIYHIRYVPERSAISFVSGRNFYLVDESGTKTGGFTDDSEDGLIAEYVWNRDRSKVAYILARPHTEEKQKGPHYSPRGVWLYDFSTGTKTKLADLGAYMETDAERNFLFFRVEKKTYRYSFSTGKMEPFPEMKLESLEMLECSSDKQYCSLSLGIGAEEGPYESIMTIFDNKRGALMLPEELDIFKGINATSVTWGATSKYMAFRGAKNKGARERSIYIYDFDNRKLVENIDIRGWIVGISPDRSTLCIYGYKLDKFIKVKFPCE